MRTPYDINQIAKQRNRSILDTANPKKPRGKNPEEWKNIAEGYNVHPSSLEEWVNRHYWKREVYICKKTGEIIN